MRRRVSRLGSVALLLALFSPLQPTASAHHENGAPHATTVGAKAEGPQAAIRAVIARTYDTADAKVETAPIVVSGDYAVADWIQGHRGGRALLRRRNGEWQIAACAGEAFRAVEGLTGAGVPADAAGRLVGLLTKAERSIADDRLKRFDSFDAMSDAGAHQHHVSHK